MSAQRAFGEALRRHREKQGITLATIARQTKIGASMLAALERGDCSRWPPGIYSRAYIRDYAESVGLDPDDLVTEFCSCFFETAFPDRPLTPQPRGAARAPHTEPLRLTLAEQPVSPWAETLRRAGFLALDILLIAGIAAALRLTAVGNIWMALAGGALLIHAAGVVFGGSPTAAVFARAIRTEPEPPASETSGESALVELT